MNKVAIVYHFFPHYRASINLELMQSKNHYYLFVGDDHDPSNTGIKAWQINDKARYLHTKSVFIMDRCLIQSGLIGLALRRDIETIIYLGIAQALTTWISALVARLAGKRVLFWTHGWTRRENGIKDIFKSAFYRLAHGLLLYGNRAKAIGVEKKFDPSRLYVIYNSLDYSLQKTLRCQYSAESITHIRRSLFENYRLPLVICTTRLVNLRRLDLLLEAMCFLKDEKHEVNLLLVGDGPERSSLERFSKKHNLSVKFYGECYDEQTLADFFMAANVTVAPGKVGLTAMHSLVYGTPVVTHDNPDDQMPESEVIIPGITGGFFKWGHSDDLARLIREWTTDEILPTEVRIRCYELIDRFYNPGYQKYIIEQAVDGIPALDTLWEEWRDINSN